jgi:polar amino acid transport system ATP-binding protein
MGNRIIANVEAARKTYGENDALRGASLSIEEGSIATIVGRSGCGKTTLLRSLNLLEIIDDGILQIAGFEFSPRVFKDIIENNKRKSFFKSSKHNNIESLPEFRELALKIRQKVGLLLQSLDLFPHKKIIDNVALAPVIVQGMDKNIASELAMSMLEKVGMSSYYDRYPHQLSGGQKQRAAIARALALKPTIMLYDEPTSALDPELISGVADFMKELKSDGMTQIIVTHSMYLAKHVSDKIFKMKDGKVVSSGSPEAFFACANDDEDFYGEYEPIMQ